MPKRLTNTARHLRQNQTDVEKLVWQRLRNRQLCNMKFRRQAPVGNYVADFLCDQCKLIVELDGGQHNDNVKDDERTAALESFGYNVLRFWNNDALENLEGVLEEIRLMVLDSLDV